MNTALEPPEILPSEAPHKVRMLVTAPGDINDHGDTTPRAAATKATAAATTTYVIKAPAFGKLRAAAVAHGPDSLPFWATHYLEAVASGGSPNTLDAKSRDLAAFIAWFGRATGTLVARTWRVLDTKSYLRHLEGRRLAPTTINRGLATLRHFARWLQERHGLFGAMGIPTLDVKDLATDEATCKKLSDEDVRGLFKAAADRVVLCDAKQQQASDAGRRDPTRRARPRRDYAMFALLYYCGLRATEQVMLRRQQYNGAHLVNVARKGQGVTRKLYIPIDGRRILDDYLANERHRDDPAGTATPLFVSTGEMRGYILRFDLADALERIADEANKHRPEGRKIRITPHMLRHTFGAKHREKSQSDSETAAALGHQSNKYVGRYARKTDEERAAVIETAMRV